MGHFWTPIGGPCCELLDTPAADESLAKLGAEPKIRSPQEFAALIADETRSWADMVRQSGITPW
jgi:tripartite-type tricarboxylate transporter receptor subunit TctC